MSRTKAKINKFLELGASPKDYTPNHMKMTPKEMHCELCGQLICYAFLLEHKTDPDKNLRVGSDCIINYVKTYLPNMMQSMIDRMELEMEKLVDEHKAKVFAEAYPGFMDKVRDLYQFLRKETPRELRYGVRGLPLFDDIERAEREYNKKKYTSEPIAKEILSWAKKKENGELTALIAEHSACVSDNKPINEQMSDKNYSEFFKEFDKYGDYMGWKASGSARTLSKLEMYSFLRNEETYLRSLKIRKTKLNKKKEQVLESLRTNISVLFSCEKLTESDKISIFGYQDLEKNVSADDAHELRANWESMSKLRATAEDYKLSFLEDRFAKDGSYWVVRLFDSLGEKSTVKRADTRSRSRMIFESNKEAEAAKAQILDFLEKEIVKLENFLNSDNLASDVFN